MGKNCLSSIALVLLAKVAASASSPLSSSSRQLAEICSCSPTVFNVILSLSQDCDDNDIADSFCFVEDVFDARDMPAAAARDSDPIRRKRRIQDSDTTPVEINSVQFLEFDTEGNLKVINQDDTYADVSLKDGDVLSFYSQSSFLDTEVGLEDQMDNVPGGASLILYGKTASGAAVRNRFFWTYTNSCEEENEPVSSGEKIGWVTIGTELGGAWPAFCPSTTPGSPTISPRTPEPTFPPTLSPIMEDSALPPSPDSKASKPHTPIDSKTGKTQDPSTSSAAPPSEPESKSGKKLFGKTDKPGNPVRPFGKSGKSTSASMMTKSSKDGGSLMTAKSTKETKSTGSSKSAKATVALHDETESRPFVAKTDKSMSYSHSETGSSKSAKGSKATTVLHDETESRPVVAKTEKSMSYSHLETGSMPAAKTEKVNSRRARGSN